MSTAVAYLSACVLQSYVLTHLVASGDYVAAMGQSASVVLVVFLGWKARQAHRARLAREENGESEDPQAQRVVVALRDPQDPQDQQDQ